MHASTPHPHPGTTPTTPVALVTGASSGIGEATARRLRDSGYTVYAGARRVERMADLEASGIRTVALDVTDDASMRACVDGILSDTGRIDVLVNNAGYGSYGAIEDVSPDEARRQFDVNVFGLARMAQLVLPTMRAQRSGTIVNVSSIGGRIWTRFGGWYHATKHAVEGLSDCMRLELAPFGIRVVVIEPGVIETEWDGIAMDSLEETSGSGPYAQAATRTAMSTRARYARGNGSGPDVVARAIASAVAAKRPRTRYAVGHLAKPLMLMRRLLPDRVLDAVAERA